MSQVTPFRLWNTQRSSEKTPEKRRGVQKLGSLILGQVRETNDPVNEALLTPAREGWPNDQQQRNEENENEANMKDRGDGEVVKILENMRTHRKGFESCKASSVV
jgi:hypothetical protein